VYVEFWSVCELLCPPWPCLRLIDGANTRLFSISSCT
jgi:hypothetical protein